MIRIHNFPRGLRGLRVAWTCEELGVPYEVVPVGFPPSAEYRALHPLGSVPFLEDGDVRIAESVAMMLHLAETHGPTPLLPTDAKARASVLELTLFGEAALAAEMTPLLAAKYGGPPEATGSWLAGAMERRVRRAIDFVDARLGGRAHLVGDVLTLADVSVSTSVGLWVGALGHEAPEGLVRWRAALSQRPAYVRAKRAIDDA